MLAKEVLKELPKQLTDYFIQKNIKPKPKKMVDRQGMMMKHQMQN
jgi:hypothetical protein